MIQVGGSVGARLLVPMSSSTMTKTCSMFALLADT